MYWYLKSPWPPMIGAAVVLGAAASLLRDAVNDPTFADVVFHFAPQPRWWSPPGTEEEEEGPHHGGAGAAVASAVSATDSPRPPPRWEEEQLAFGHRLVLGRGSATWARWAAGGSTARPHRLLLPRLGLLGCSTLSRGERKPRCLPLSGRVVCVGWGV